VILGPFHPAHLLEIELQRATPKDVSLFSDPTYGEALASGDSRSVFDDAGHVRACLGVFEAMPGLGWAWAMFSPGAAKLLPEISDYARDYLATCRFRRIEGHINPAFRASIRWAKRMGFQFEGVMRRHTPNGDAHLYAWVRQETT
jgi:hypothetical protein